MTGATTKITKTIRRLQPKFYCIVYRHNNKAMDTDQGIIRQHWIFGNYLKLLDICKIVHYYITLLQLAFAESISTKGKKKFKELENMHKKSLTLSDALPSFRTSASAGAGTSFARKLFRHLGHTSR